MNQQRPIPRDLSSATASNRPPLVTIGLPVYNGEAYLGATLDSLVSQTLGDFELVISDNASTDRTGEICHARAAADSRIRYLRQDINIGIVANFQCVLDHARGKYFRWTSANDLCRPNLLEHCVRVLEEQPDVAVAFGLTALIDDAGLVVGEYDRHLHVTETRPSDRFIHYLNHVGLNTLFAGVARTDSIRRTRPLGNFLGSDTVLLAEMALYGKFFEVQETLFLRRMSRSATTQGKTLAELQQIFNPGRSKLVILPVWRQQWELFRTVGSSRVAVSEKLKATWFVFKCYYWRRRLLLKELLGIPAQLTGRHRDDRDRSATKVNSWGFRPKMKQ